MKRIMTGIKPTNKLHIGNYFGTIPSFQRYINSNNELLLFVPDLHAMTNGPLETSAYDILRFYIACLGDKPIYYIQSHFSQFSEASWFFACITKNSELFRMTQYKSLADKGDTNAGYLFYPLLMASDILMVNADIVPVGIDQTQHIELTRDIGKVLNNKYGFSFTIPDILYTECRKIMDLKDITKKMSKSLMSDISTIYINDSDDEISKKIKSAVTDNQLMPNDLNLIEQTRPAIYNLCLVLEACSNRKYESFNFGGKKISEFKSVLSENIINFIRPLRETMKEISNNQIEILINKNKNYINEILNKNMFELKNTFLNFS